MVMRLINLFFRPLGLKNKVVIISRQSDKPSLDISMLYERLSDADIETVLLCKTLKKSLSGALSYGLHFFQQMYHIATSKVIVIDGYCILVSILPKKKGQTVIQMWHALGAVKKFGWQTVDKEDGHSDDVAELMQMHKNYDYVLAPSETTGRFFAEGFRTPFNKVKLIGLPRIDKIRECDDKAQDVRNEITKVYPQVDKKINVLYVPTFRKNQALNLEKLVDNFDFGKYNFIIKKHFLDKGDYSFAEKMGAIFDDRFSSMDWLRICPKVITDYSAMAFEAAIINRELYIYQPDIDKYDSKVGLNMNMKEEAISDYVCYTEKSLIDAIDQDYDAKAIEAFKNKYLQIDLEDCTGQLCAFIGSFLN